MPHLNGLFSSLLPTKASALAASAAAADISRGMTAHDGALIGAIVAVVVVMVLIVLAMALIIIVSIWKVFEKAEVPGWAVLVPFYNRVKMLEITNEPFWWIFLSLVPVVNIFIWVIVTNRVSRAFGKGGWFTVGLILLPFIFYPILAFGSAKYKNSFPARGELSEPTKYALIAAFVSTMMWLVSMGNTTIPSTQPLSVLEGGYAVDGNYVYYNDVVVSDADPRTFSVDSAYARDAYHVFYDGKELRDADSRSFRILDNYGTYAKDDTTVFSGALVLDANAATFKVTENSDDEFATDGINVYDDNGGKIHGADPQTFELLGLGYERDASHVYYYGSVVPQADVETFTVMSNDSTDYDAKDKNHRYSGGDVYTGAARPALE